MSTLDNEIAAYQRGVMDTLLDLQELIKDVNKHDGTIDAVADAIDSRLPSPGVPAIDALRSAGGQETG